MRPNFRVEVFICGPGSEETTGVLMVLVAFPYHRSPGRVSPAPWVTALPRKRLPRGMCSSPSLSTGFSTGFSTCVFSVLPPPQWEVRALLFGQLHTLPSSSAVALSCSFTTLLTHLVLRTTPGGRKAEYGGRHLQTRKLKRACPQL